MKVRVRRALWLVTSMLGLSLLLVGLGIYTTTRTDSLSVSGYLSGVILAFGSFLGVLGLCLEENRKQLVTAAIVFLSLGIIAAFLCLVIDGVFVVFSMDVRPLKAGRCQFYTTGNSYIYENYYASVPCRNLKESCSLTVRSGTCYCCDLYDCANGGYLDNYYQFAGVRGCGDVLALYGLIWALAALNLLGLVVGMVTTAVLGSVKHLRSPVNRSSENRMSSPTAPLLMEANTHTVDHQHTNSSAYFSPTAATSGACQRAASVPSLQMDPNPPPFAPLAGVLPWQRQGLSRLNGLKPGP